MISKSTILTFVSLLSISLNPFTSLYTLDYLCNFSLTHLKNVPSDNPWKTPIVNTWCISVDCQFSKWGPPTKNCLPPLSSDHRVSSNKSYNFPGYDLHGGKFFHTVYRPRVPTYESYKFTFYIHFNIPLRLLRSKNSVNN